MVIALPREDLVDAAKVALTLALGAAAIAAVVRLTAAEQAREALAFTFPGVPNALREAAGIFANNTRIMLAVVVASGVAQAAIRSGADGAAGHLAAALVRLCDLALVCWCGFQVLLVGTALGAYGGRAMWPIVAHLPFELAGFSLVLAAYLRARRQRVPAGRIAATALLAVIMLAAGSVVEVYA